ncbi:hypothetical protein CEP53_011953 [Fusarium sp. AF-6]|nr:hypothetical protein CEP53_011953 [Fusarium sp. AF-6]
MSPSTIASWPWASDRPLAWIQEAVGGDFHCCSQVVSASRCNAFNLTTPPRYTTIDSPTYSGTCTLPLFPESTRSDNR